jgi:type I restriction enzyme S subunit
MNRTLEITLGEVCDFVGGSQPAKKFFLNTKKEGYVRLIQIRDYKSDNYLTYIPVNSTRKFCNKTDIMIGRYGPPIFQILRGIEGAYNVALMKAIPKANIVHNYLYYFLTQEYLFEYVNALSPRTGGQTGVDVVMLKQFPIQLPKLEKQKQIAKILSDLDVKIEVNNKINQELEAMAKTLYDYWFVQFDFPDANGKSYKSSGGKTVFNEELKREIPKGWLVKNINEVIEVKDGTHDSPKSIEKGFKLITSKHLKTEGLNFDKANSISEEDYTNINKRSKVNTGDILFSMIGNIGTVYKVEEKTIDFVIKNVALYKTSENQHLKNYTYMYLRGYDMQKYTGSVIAGSIQKFIGLGSLRKMPFMFDEKTISNFEIKTKPIFNQINNLKLENQKLSELRDWLLLMLMNGQVTVGAADAEIERLDIVAERVENYNTD